MEGLGKILIFLLTTDESRHTKARNMANQENGKGAERRRLLTFPVVKSKK